MAKQMPASQDRSQKVLHADDRELITQWVEDNSFTDGVTFSNQPETDVIVKISPPYYHSDLNELVGAMVRQFPIQFEWMGRNNQSIWFKAD